jgi:hypothetical protein
MFPSRNGRQQQQQQLDQKRQFPLALVLKETLSVVIHYILYGRGVYAKEIFSKSTYQGVCNVYVTEHPGLCAYINSTLDVASVALANGK